MRQVLVLMAAATLASTANADPERPAHPNHDASKIVALVGVSLGLTALAINLDVAADDHAAHAKPIQTDALRQRETRDYNVAKYAGTGTFAAGCVALGIAGALFIHERHVYERTLVAPMVAPGQFGIAASGSF